MGITPPRVLVIAAASAMITRSRRALFSRSGNVHGQLASLQFFVVEHFNGFGGFFRGGHLDERKASGLAGEFVKHHIDGPDHAGLREVILQIVRLGLVGEVAHEESCWVHLDRLIRALDRVGRFCTRMNHGKWPGILRLTICLADTDTAGFSRKASR